jgi:hypothetical protein
MRAILCLVCVAVRIAHTTTDTGQCLEEDSPDERFHLEIPDDARLYAAPGSAHSQRLLLTNRGRERKTIMISHRENFVIDDRHAELVWEIRPTYVQNFGHNDTEILTVEFRVPAFVSVGARSRVTVVVQSNGDKKMERSFLFTVADKPLHHFDSSPPECGEIVVCSNCSEVLDYDDASCNDTYWRSELQVVDSVSGLRNTSVGQAEGTWDPSVRFVRPLMVGTPRQQTLSVAATCCVTSISVLVSDVAGNTAECRVHGRPEPVEQALDAGHRFVSSASLSVAAFCIIYRITGL